MKKIRKYIFTILVLIGIAAFIGVYAIDIDDPSKLVNITKAGESGHGSYTVRYDENNQNGITTSNDVLKSNYVVHMELSADPGYYVDGFEVRFNGNDLVLGFVAGSENGAFFREYDFSLDENVYEFFIPEAATEDNKVEVSIHYAEKASFDISYMNYTGNEYDPDSLRDVNNYGEAKMLVEGYRDGDIILPDDAAQNGSVLIFSFNEEYYNFINQHQMNNGGNFNAEAVILFDGRNENMFDVECDDENHVCYVIINKGFEEISLGRIYFGYNDFKVYMPGFIGFDSLGDVNNFNDSNMAVGFTQVSHEAYINQLFYGTKKLYLSKIVPRPVVNSGANNCGSFGEFDDVSGSGYGYSVSYSGNVATISISSYYQDILTAELNIKNGGTNVFGEPVKLHMNRYAFNEVAIETDEIGRNCQEGNNGNTCNQGKYFSVEYRGVLSSFYTQSDEAEELNSLMVIDNIDTANKTVDLNYWSQQENAYLRDKSFTPNVLALFYDDRDMIVSTKTFDLNHDVDASGYISKANFNTIFDGYTLNMEVNRDYVRIGHDEGGLPIENLDYFDHIDNAAIMHYIVLMDTEEAKDLNVRRVAIFLINGKIEEDAIPSLTYGVGEGRIFQFHYENQNGGE